MILGYNTNGFPHHRIEDTFRILAEIGFRSVAVTLEYNLIDPPERRGASACAKRLKRLLQENELRATIETGSRFLLDPRRKHQPTLISSDDAVRSRRVEFLKAAVEVAGEIGADSVSLWSGTADDASDEVLMDRLLRGLRELLVHAEPGNVRLAFEPEPGMFIDTMDKYAKLHHALDHPLFGLTLDVGHVHCLSDGSLEDHTTRWKDRLWNVHVEDMRRGRHEHLMFGEGEIDFRDIFHTIRKIGYAGPVHVELSRHGHDSVNVARRSFDFLKSFFDSGSRE